jgi:hypothetical protein
MSILKFDLNAFINDDYYTLDRVQEKYKTDTIPLMIDTKDKELNRRWSLSVPASPKLSSKNMFESQTPRLTIDIPNEEKETYEDESPSFSPSPTNYVIGSYDLTFCSSIDDITIYVIPSKDAYDARRIWKRARISHSSNVRDIDISWITHSNCICSSTWSTFLKWMLCACSSNSNVAL